MKKSLLKRSYLARAPALTYMGPRGTSSTEQSHQSQEDDWGLECSLSVPADSNRGVKQRSKKNFTG